MVSATTHTDPILYRNIEKVRAKVHEALRQELRTLQETDNLKLDWTTEIIQTIEKRGKRKCEDTLKIIMTVEHEE